MLQVALRTVDYVTRNAICFTWEVIAVRQATS